VSCSSTSTPMGRPLVLGHRGASHEAPENTLAAFRLALEQGADGVELDVWRCGSGEVVVIHDPGTGRTAPDGPSVDVRRASLRQLRALDVGAWKGDRFRGERIPALSEVLEALPGAVVNVELKSARWPDLALARAAADVIAAAGAGARCVVSSFDPILLAAFRRASPAVAAGVLFGDDQAWRAREAVGTRLLGASAVHPQATLVTESRARRWRARGLRLNVWTVDDPREVEQLARLGAAAVITNRPAVARQALGAAGVQDQLV
jgi:glycerophosphoryl diester phosphodiesterase